MKIRLNIMLDDQLIRQAKFYAKSKNTSISNLVESHLRKLVDNDDLKEITPKVKSLMGIVKFPKNLDYKKEMQKNLLKKYGF
jgi:hypothetical protein